MILEWGSRVTSNPVDLPQLSALDPLRWPHSVLSVPQHSTPAYHVESVRGTRRERHHRHRDRKNDA